METIEQIMEDEGGYQAETYLCSAGKLTWLYGRNIEDRPITNDEWSLLKKYIQMGLSQRDWAKELFEAECRDLTYYFGSAPEKFWSELPEEVQVIILNMAYNMGLSRFNPYKWPNFFNAIKNRNWKQAAIEGRDSRWFHQVGRRSERLMNSLENVE